MKKIILFQAIFLALSAFLFSADKSKKKPAAQADKDDPPMIMIGDYDDEEEPAKVEKSDMEPKETEKETPKQQENAATKEIKNPAAEKGNAKKSASIPKNMILNYEFDAFSIKIPTACDIQMSEDKKASALGESGATCPVKGHLGQFDKKIEVKYLVEMYKKRCEKSKRKQLYRKWLNTKSLEGYLTICQGEDKTEVAMEANSVTGDLNFQFLGSVKGGFTQEKKIAIYMMLNSITAKNTGKPIIPSN